MNGISYTFSIYNDIVMPDLLPYLYCFGASICKISRKIFHFFNIIIPWNPYKYWYLFVVLYLTENLTLFVLCSLLIADLKFVFHIYTEFLSPHGLFYTFLQIILHYLAEYPTPLLVKSSTFFSKNPYSYLVSGFPLYILYIILLCYFTSKKLATHYLLIFISYYTFKHNNKLT